MSSTNEKPRPLVAAEEENKISRNVLIWINTFPDIPDAVLDGTPLAPINFEFLKDNVPGMTMSTIQAPYITNRYIYGGYEAEYQFKVIYRIIPGNITGPDKRLKADELLDRLGDWVQCGTPDLGNGIRALRVEPTTRSSLFAIYENGDEDHQILMKMTYENLSTDNPWFI